jgi:5-methylcytosine-specific restriction endonuclease McrA
MSNLRPKRPRRRLGRAAYTELHQQILIRDAWRCQQCGRSESLEVHHIQSRSKLGDDACENLITLCANCHCAVHVSQKRVRYSSTSTG